MKEFRLYVEIHLFECFPGCFLDRCKPVEKSLNFPRTIWEKIVTFVNMTKKNYDFCHGFQKSIANFYQVIVTNFYEKGHEKTGKCCQTVAKNQ